MVDLIIIQLVHLETNGLSVAIKGLDDAKCIYDGDLNMSCISTRNRTAWQTVSQPASRYIIVFSKYYFLKENRKWSKVKVTAFSHSNHSTGHEENNQIALWCPK